MLIKMSYAICGNQDTLSSLIKKLDDVDKGIGLLVRFFFSTKQDDNVCILI